jgi:hypothetical protein
MNGEGSIMGGKWPSRALLGVSVSLALLPGSTGADFSIEFTDGQRVTVSQYVDEGQTLKIYTPQGAIAFRKDDVKRITEVGITQSTDTPLDTATARPAAPLPVPTSDSSAGLEPPPAPDKAQAAGKERVAGGSPLTEADLEGIETHYQDVSRRYSELWQKHRQDFHAGAAAEELAENRRQLLRLDQERKALKEKVRQGRPDELPAWAQ